jgi:hypothetical protein
MKIFQVKPQINKESVGKVVETTKTGVKSVLSFTGDVLGAVATSMAHQANCERGFHELNSFGTCKHCYKKPQTPIVVIGGIGVSAPQCNHTWGKADSFTVVCLSCGKRLSRGAWDEDESAWAKAILKQLED